MHSHTGADAAAPSDTVERVVVPVIAEQIAVEKRSVETGRVRIHKETHSREQIVDEPLLRERVRVERVLIGREVASAPPVRQEGDTLVISVVEEKLVVEKRLVLREEIRVTREREIAPGEPVRVSLREEEAHVERLPPPSPNPLTQEKQP